jgi:hypothetical protein
MVDKAPQCAASGIADLAAAAPESNDYEAFSPIAAASGIADADAAAPESNDYEAFSPIAAPSGIADVGAAAQESNDYGALSSIAAPSGIADVGTGAKNSVSEALSPIASEVVVGGVGGEPWLVFDESTRWRAVADMTLVLRSYTSFGAMAVAGAMINGTAEAFQAAKRNDSDCAEVDLCELWEAVCIFRPRMTCARVAACIVAAFVRAGLPLRPPFPLVPSRDHNDANSNGLSSSFSPLCMAAEDSPVLAMALLDLPLSCGLDVDYIDGNERLVVQSPAVAATNGNRLATPAMFRRLLERTDRSVVNAGSVYVNCGLHQMYRWKTHVLISNIFRCLDAEEDNNGLAMARVFVAAALPDGDGTDLTGGVARRDDCPENCHLLTRMFPNEQFRGALPLLDTLVQLVATDWIGKRCRDPILAQLLPLRKEIMASMSAIRLYRLSLGEILAAPLAAADIHATELHRLVASYVLVPLHDESQLNHSLLSSFPPTRTLSFPPLNLT